MTGEDKSLIEKATDEVKGEAESVKEKAADVKLNLDNFPLASNMARAMGAEEKGE
jgi:hypothetical protein